MRSQFTSTFQPARRISSGFQPVLAYRTRRSAAPVMELGVTVFADQRNSMLTTIENGTKRLADVRKWIASRIDQDPMLLRTFGQQYIADNFWAYDDIATKDQYYVDQALQALTGDLEMYDLSDETIGRVDEWALVIDNMYGGMQEYGKTPLTNPSTGAPVQGTTPPATSVPPASGSNPKAPLTTPPAGAAAGAKGGTFLGMPSDKVLLYGGVGLGALILIGLIKKYK